VKTAHLGEEKLWSHTSAPCGNTNQGKGLGFKPQG